MPYASGSLRRPLLFTGAIALIGALAAAKGLATHRLGLAVAGLVIVVVAAILGYSVWRTVNAAGRGF